MEEGAEVARPSVLVEGTWSSEAKELIIMDSAPSGCKAHWGYDIPELLYFYQGMWQGFRVQTFPAVKLLSQALYFLSDVFPT